jgi:hypothetical protein
MSIDIHLAPAVIIDHHPERRNGQRLQDIINPYPEHGMDKYLDEGFSFVAAHEDKYTGYNGHRPVNFTGSQKSFVHRPAEHVCPTSFFHQRLSLKIASKSL